MRSGSHRSHWSSSKFGTETVWNSDHTVTILEWPFFNGQNEETGGTSHVKSFWIIGDWSKAKVALCLSLFDYWGLGRGRSFKPSFWGGDGSKMLKSTFKAGIWFWHPFLPSKPIAQELLSDICTRVPSTRCLTSFMMPFWWQSFKDFLQHWSRKNATMKPPEQNPFNHHETP